MLPSFLTPRIDQLEAGGEIRAVAPAAPLGRLLPPVLLVSRAHCTFQRLDLAGLKGRAARQAANLHAVGAAPYPESGYALAPGRRAAGIWFWNAERIRHQSGSTARRAIIAPETLTQPPGHGWRIVKLSGGYEAQAWSEGELVGSAWRRDRFDVPSWLNFTRTAALDGAPEQPPEAQSLPLVLTPRIFTSGSSAPDLRRTAALAGAFGAAAAVLAAFFLAGQALRLESETSRLEEETARLAPPADAPTAAAARRALQASLQQFEPAAGRTSPLSAAEVVVGITALHEVAPSRLTIEEDEVELVLPYDALPRTADLAAEFSASGYFDEVRPRPNAEARELVFHMRVRPGLPPLREDG